MEKSTGLLPKFRAIKIRTGDVVWYEGDVYTFQSQGEQQIIKGGPLAIALLGYSIT